MIINYFLGLLVLDIYACRGDKRGAQWGQVSGCDALCGGHRMLK